MPTNTQDSCEKGHKFVAHGPAKVFEKGTPGEVTRQPGRCSRPGCGATATNSKGRTATWSGWYEYTR